MNRGRQLKLNTLAGLLSQVVSFICGFIVPKLILNYYGSEVNGLVSSIAHFLSFISLAECGMGVVIQSSLYKPLAEHDDKQISRVIVSSERFFRKIGLILSAYVILLFFIYPFLAETSFDTWYTVILIGAISISTFVQYFICISYRLLLTADQKGYIQLLLNIVAQILNTILCVILAKCGCSIQLLKLSASAIMLLQAMLLALYVKKHYNIDRKVQITGEPIKQKWNGVAQHIAFVVLENTPTVVLTMFATMASVSVYNVYHLVVNGIKGIVHSAVAGMQSLLGNMYAKQEKEALDQAFSYYEWAIHLVVVFLYTCTAILIVPFVQIYTDGVTDANYVYPLFGVMISMGQMLYCLRLPYNAMIFASGHYKETQNGAFIEAAINVVASVVLVVRFGLIGVAIGTFLAMTYRTVHLVMYLRKHILMRPAKHFIKHVVIDVAVIGLSLLATSSIELGSPTYLSWIIMALKIALIVGAIVISANILLYMDLFRVAVKKVLKKHR